MGYADDNRERVPGDLRRRLAVTVKSVQWSYAIFWSLSTTQEETLEWGQGYYNGDIKTTKTVAAMEIKAADKTGLQRSEQLRELYESLLESDQSDQQTRRPSAALNPDDLSDAEWFYLVCMSFVFNPGQGLPGRALANGEAIWLCNAHCADSKVFSRSLLAKSASIQTVLCFPHFGGVIELGIADLVAEDPNLLQHIKTSLLELSKPVCSDNTSSASHTEDGSDQICIKVEEEDSFLLDQDDCKNDLCNCIQASFCSMNPEEEGNTDDLHYKRTLSVILKNSGKLFNNMFFIDGKYRSSFKSWKRGEIVEGQYEKPKVQQKVLKKILLHVPYMYDPGSVETNKYPKMSAENEKFLVLKSLVPSISEIDKESILGDTIRYLKELEARVEELESCVDYPSDCEAAPRTKRRQDYQQETVEQTSDNIYDNEMENCKRKSRMTNKRKACNFVETDSCEKESLPLEMKVSVKEGNVLIEMKCVWREYLLLEIIDAIGSLNLEAYSVQSSNAAGILTINLHSKVKGTSVASTWMIKQALSKVVEK